MGSEADFFSKYDAEIKLFHRLELAANLSNGEKAHLKTLSAMRERGFAATKDRAKVSWIEKEALAAEFVRIGPKAALRAGSQRAGDFLNNQIRGRWAEDVVRLSGWPNVRIIEFGPSGSAMPGEEDHGDIVRTFRAIELLEGKRPDLLAFTEGNWKKLTIDQQRRAESWPRRLLDDDDMKILPEALCGIEVKSSLWHYEKRLAAGRGPLSVTLKAEEVNAFSDWIKAINRPIVFFQVFLDQLYVMSFERMLDAIAGGKVVPQDEELEPEETGEGEDAEPKKDRKTGKGTFMFKLEGKTQQVGLVQFPDDTKAVVTVLDDGSVVPHLRFAPASGKIVNVDRLDEEVQYKSAKAGLR